MACTNPPTEERPGGLVVVQAPSSAGVPGWVLIDTIKVRSVDASGNPRPGATLTWVVTQGNGSVAQLNATTDAEGISAALWTLGDRAGANELRVSAVDDGLVTFQVIGEAFRVDRLDSGFDVGCGLLGGAIWCWGKGFWGTTPPASDRELFGLEMSSPGWIDGTRGFVDVAVSGSSVCGLDDKGEVWCASENAQQMAPVSGLPSIRRVVGAGSSVPENYCALAVSDSVPWCWQAGGAATQVPGSPAFTDLWMERSTNSPRFIACGLRADSTVACWGEGPLGDGSTGFSDTPVTVGGNHRFEQLAVGDRFACGRTVAGEVWCWGKNAPNLGGGPDILLPTLVTTGAFRIAAGQEWAQMISVGPVVRWEGAGFNFVSRPTGLSNLQVLGFAANDFSCIHLVDGQVYCYDEMWVIGSVVGLNNYSPVQPLRAVPELVARD